MKTLLLPALLLLPPALPTAWADVPPPPSRFAKASPEAKPEPRPQPDFFKEVKQGVQITELGCMRVTFVFDGKSALLETRVTEAFSNADFRVFSTGRTVTERLQPKSLHQIGNDRYADLVVYTTVSATPKASLGNLALVEAEATVQVYNPMSEELLVSHTERKTGKRTADGNEAVRSAVEAATDAAVKEVILKTLEKAHKILVHEAQLKGVLDHQHLLDIMEYSAKLKGVYHVRQLTYDKTSGIAVIEIIGAPQTESFWRAYLNNLPKHEILVGGGKPPQIKLNEKLRASKPDWFTK